MNERGYRLPPRNVTAAPRTPERDAKFPGRARPGPAPRPHPGPGGTEPAGEYPSGGPGARSPSREELQGLVARRQRRRLAAPSGSLGAPGRPPPHRAPSSPPPDPGRAAGRAAAALSPPRFVPGSPLSTASRGWGRHRPARPRLWRRPAAPAKFVGAAGGTGGKAEAGAPRPVPLPPGRLLPGRCGAFPRRSLCPPSPSLRYLRPGAKASSLLHDNHLC